MPMLTSLGSGRARIQAQAVLLQNPAGLSKQGLFYPSSKGKTLSLCHLVFPPASPAALSKAASFLFYQFSHDLSVVTSGFCRSCSNSLRSSTSSSAYKTLSYLEHVPCWTDGPDSVVPPPEACDPGLGNRTMPLHQVILTGSRIAQWPNT